MSKLVIVHKNFFISKLSKKKNMGMKSILCKNFSDDWIFVTFKTTDSTSNIFFAGWEIFFRGNNFIKVNNITEMGSLIKLFLSKVFHIGFAIGPCLARLDRYTALVQSEA